MLKKTIGVLELSKEVIDRASAINPQDRAFLEAAFSAYLSAMAYAETEKEVSAILDKRLKVTGDEKLSNFIVETYGKSQGRLKRSDIADVAKRFGEECKSTFVSSADDKLVAQYNNLLECRHSLAHGEPKTATITSIEEGISAANVLLVALSDSIQ